jgi:hypothetical protein
MSQSSRSRKLAGIMCARWRDETSYEPERVPLRFLAEAVSVLQARIDGLLRRHACQLTTP